MLLFNLLQGPHIEHPIADVIQPPIRSWGVVIQFQITRIVENPVASLTLRSLLRQQNVIHLCATHSRPLGFLDTLLRLEKWDGFLPVIRSHRRPRLITDLPLGQKLSASISIGCRQPFALQPADDCLVSLIPYVDPHPLPAKTFRGYRCRCTAAKWIEHDVAFVGRGSDDPFIQDEGFLRRVSRTFLGQRIDYGNVPYVIDRRTFRIGKIFFCRSLP